MIEHNPIAARAQSFRDDSPDRHGGLHLEGFCSGLSANLNDAMRFPRQEFDCESPEDDLATRGFVAIQYSAELRKQRFQKQRLSDSGWTV